MRTRHKQIHAALLVLSMGSGPGIAAPPGAALEHSEQVFQAVFSPDGKTLATVSADRTAILWDTATGRARVRLTGHRHQVQAAAFRPDGKQVATGGADGQGILWDPSSGRQLRALPLADNQTSAEALAYSPDGKLVITGGYRAGPRAWDADTGRAVRSFSESSTLRERLSGASIKVSSAAFDCKGERLLTASNKGVSVWNAGSGGKLWNIADPEHVPRVARWNADGTRVVVPLGASALVLDGANGRVVHRLKTPGSEVNDANFSPDGMRITTAGDDASVQLWDASKGRLMESMKGHGNFVHMAPFSPDGSLIASCSNDGTARLWNGASGRPLFVLEGHKHSYVTWVSFSPDGKLVATASADSTARVWDAATGQLLHTLGTPRAEAE
jgi:WD40 repeat protein